MKYDACELNQDGKALICPRCKNEEIHPNYPHCKICGGHLTNKCAGEGDYDWNNNFFYKQEPCDIQPDGNARYCMNCGCETTFFNQKLLQPWNEVK